jgi:hypothetical protein
MPKYEITTTKTIFNVHGGQVYELSLIGQAGPSRTVEAKSLTHLHELFIAFALELTSDGGECMRLSVHKCSDEKARAFPGLKKEVARGGIMNILVNKRQAVEAA